MTRMYVSISSSMYKVPALMIWPTSGTLKPSMSITRYPICDWTGCARERARFQYYTLSQRHNNIYQNYAIFCDKICLGRFFAMFFSFATQNPVPVVLSSSLPPWFCMRRTVGLLVLCVQLSYSPWVPHCRLIADWKTSSKHKWVSICLAVHCVEAIQFVCCSTVEFSGWLA